MARWGILVVLAGCGFRSSELVTDASPGGSDSGTDTGGTTDGLGTAPGCWQHWLDGNVEIAPTSVQPITELSGTTDDRWPWISENGLKLYFSRNPGMAGQGDIYLSIRPTSSDPFPAPSPVTNLNSTRYEARASLTPDELTLVLSTNKDNMNQFDIHINTRNPGDGFGTPDGTHLGTLNNAGIQHYDPFLSTDRLRLYLVTNTGPSSRLQIAESTRSSVTVDFPVSSPVGNINDANSNTMDPALYQNERVIVFASDPQSGSADLWYAIRADPGGRFGSPIRVPSVNTPFADVDPALSDDGCELFFSSNRGVVSRYQLFHAQVTK